MTSPSADMVRLNVNVQFQVKPLSAGTSSSRTHFFFQKNLYGPPKGVLNVNVQFQVNPLSAGTSSS